MKKVVHISILLFGLIAVSQEASAIETGRFSLEGGLSPNTALGLNVYADGAFHWSERFSTALQFSRKDHTKVSSDREYTEIGGEESTRAAFQPLCVSIPLSSRDGRKRGLDLSIEGEWVSTKRIDQLTEIWVDDQEIQQTCISSYKRFGTLFGAAALVEATFENAGSSLALGMKLIPYSFLVQTYQGFGYTSDPDPDAQKASYEQYYFEPESILCGGAFALRYHSPEGKRGAFGFAADIGYRAGYAGVLDQFWDETAETFVFDEYESILQMIDWSISFAWFLPGSSLSGSRFGVRAGYYGQIAFVDEYTDDTLTTHQFDLGIIVKR